MTSFWRWTCFVATALFLSACALDREQILRDELSAWLFLGETRHFTSTMSCTVAIFDLARSEVSSDVARSLSIETALERIRGGQAVLFEFPGSSPNDISEQLMSHDLGEGLGMLSSGVGPVRDCMEQHVGNAFYAVLMAPQSRAIYDPNGNSIILVYPPENLAFFLRGNV